MVAEFLSKTANAVKKVGKAAGKKVGAKIADDLMTRIMEDLGVNSFLNKSYDNMKQSIIGYIDPTQSLKTNLGIVQSKEAIAKRLVSSARIYQTADPNSKQYQSAYIELGKISKQHPELIKSIDPKSNKINFDLTEVNPIVQDILQERKDVLQKTIKKARQDLAKVNKSLQDAKNQFNTIDSKADMAVALKTKLIQNGKTKLGKENFSAIIEIFNKAQKYGLVNDNVPRTYEDLLEALDNNVDIYDKIKAKLAQKITNLENQRQKLNQFVNEDSDELMNLKISYDPSEITGKTTKKATRAQTEIKPSVSTTTVKTKTNQDVPVATKNQANGMDSNLKSDFDIFREIKENIQDILDDIKEYFPKFLTKEDCGNSDTATGTETVTTSAEVTKSQSEISINSILTVLNENLVNFNNTIDQFLTQFASWMGQSTTEAKAGGTKQPLGKTSNRGSKNNKTDKTGKKDQTDSSGIFGNWKETLKNSADQMGDWSTNVKNVVANTAQSLQSTMSTVFLDAFQGKLKSFKDYFKSFASSILQSLSNALANSFTNSVINFLARADGGTVTSGNTYLVGERGPELFVANTTGTIIPNHKLGVAASPAAPQVTVNVINNSGQAVSARQESRFDGQSYVVDVWLDALNRNVGGLRDIVLAGR